MQNVSCFLFIDLTHSLHLLIHAIHVHTNFIKVSHPGLRCAIVPNGSNRAPGGTAPGGRMSGMALNGSELERGSRDLKGSTIIPPRP